MTALLPADGAIPKPTRIPKDSPRGLSRGGKRPKEAGRRFEARFAKKYDDPPLVKFRRQVGSGAFGKVDPGLLADVLGDIGSLLLAFEVKSWDRHDARGQKVLTIPSSVLYKLDLEAKTLNRHPVLIAHLKGDEEEWAVCRYSWLHSVLKELQRQVVALNAQVEALSRSGNRDEWFDDEEAAA